MRYLIINGQKREIPKFPHHKDYIYRCNRFFEVKSLFSFLTINGYFSTIKELRRNSRHKCAVPRDLLIDPTSSCNLKCKGCWAADYSKGSNIPYEKLDEILGDAQKLGIKDIMMSGGEPLMRKEEILMLAGKYRKMTFGAFTNGTLIDEEFADGMVKIGNLNVFISIEGYKEETDFRRGEGTYDKVIKAMNILKERDHGFGFSICYHSKNYKTICSDEFLDFLREKGAWFGWLFNYMPIGSDADVSLCCTAEQRAYVMRKIDDYSKRNKFTLIDFANSGHKALGCVAAGNDFAHINASGDLEPCAFCHYSDTNILDKRLIDALKSPFFKKFRAAKPFSGNYLTPCPMMDNPESLVEVTNMAGVKSTHMFHPESSEELAAKTRSIAGMWRPVATKIFAEMPKSEKRRFGILHALLRTGNYYKNNQEL